MILESLMEWFSCRKIGTHSFFDTSHKTKIPWYAALTMAAASYEDNPAELHPWYYTQREPIASTFNFQRSCIFPAAGSSAASHLRVELFCPYYPATIDDKCGSNKAAKTVIRSVKDTPRVSIWSLYNIWPFPYFWCGWFSIGGHPTLRTVVTVLLRYYQRHCGSNEAIELRILSWNVTPRVAICTIYNYWPFVCFSFGWFSIGGPPSSSYLIA